MRIALLPANRLIHSPTIDMVGTAEEQVTGPVRVTLLRRHGRTLKQSEAEATKQYLGSINSHYLRTRHLVTMRTGLPSDNRTQLPPDLYHPVFSAVRDHLLRIYGIESVGGAAYAQEWKIDFL